MTKYEICFRPLTGILFFNDITPYKSRRRDKSSFRPLTGILFFNGREERG